MKKLLTCGAFLLAAAAQTLLAVPARRDVVKTVEQPDGTLLEVRQIGDEHAHCYVTTDMVPVLRDDAGRYCYATVDASGNAVASTIMARNVELRSASEKAFIQAADINSLSAKVLNSKKSARRMSAPSRVNQSSGLGLNSALFPHMGDVHALVILIEYSDVKFRTPNAGEYYKRFLNQEGFSEHGGTGSARDYFIASSSGQFTPTFDVYGPATLDKTRAYYGENTSPGNDARAAEMVRDACLKLDGQINFADYDSNNDGEVDNIYVIYADQGEASFGPAESIWPHQWQLAGEGLTLTLDGKKIDHYGCCNEYDQTKPSGIGTFCHEFGHVMGLPDLYDTSGYGSATYATPHSWCIMDYGSYNNDGRTPPSYSIYERNAMGWIDPTVINGRNTISLDNIHDSNQGCIINTTNRNEFFLFENRQQTGWDTYLPGHGMLVWHIDYNDNIFNKNVVNNNPNHQYVDIEEACGYASAGSETALSQYPFPGPLGKTEFTDDTRPSMMTWAGQKMKLPITEITEKDGVITFNVCGGRIELDRPEAKIEKETDGGFTIRWEPVDMALSYNVNVFTKDEAGAMALHPEYVDFNVEETSCEVSRLDPETTYYATVTAVHDIFLSEPSEEVSVLTGTLPFDLLIPKADKTRLDGDSFTASWQPIDGASEYLLTVTSDIFTTGETEVADFGTPGENALVLPEGWTTTGSQQRTASYCGEAIPALRFSADKQELVTRMYDMPIIGLKFFYRGTSSTKNSLDIDGLTSEDGQWENLFVINPIPKDGETVEFNEIPDDIHQIRVVFHRSTGTFCIDDFAVTTGATTQEIFGDYDSRAMGNVTSHVVSGLPAGTQECWYTVQAKSADGTLSLKSTPVRVTTELLGVDDIDVDNSADAPAELYNLQGVRINGSPAAGIYIRRTGAKAEKIIIR